MAKRTRKRMKGEEAEVPLSSMIDVVFLLLIYFIVTQKPIIDDTLLGCNLPAPDAVAKEEEEPPNLFTVDVHRLYPNDPDKDMQYYYLNGNRYPFEQLKQVLSETRKNDPDMTVIINCGPNAQHRKLIQLLDACAEADLTKLNVVNDEAVKFVPMIYED